MAGVLGCPYRAENTIPAWRAKQWMLLLHLRILGDPLEQAAGLVSSEPLSMTLAVSSDGLLVKTCEGCRSPFFPLFSNL